VRRLRSIFAWGAAHAPVTRQAVTPVAKRGALPAAIIAIPHVTRSARETQAAVRIVRVWRYIVRRWTAEAWVALLASIASIVSYVYYVQQGLTLAYSDSISHMMIARRVFASSTPGLAQLGTVWLPLNHILMLPFAWNDTLYRDGFAGTFPSMVAYVVGAIYMYRLAALVFSSQVAGWVGALALMLNPNMLYMQSTPMSELDLICFAVIAIYYAVRWARTFDADDLVKCALATAAGTLVRYDGWALALALLVVVGAMAWRLRGRLIAESHVLLYSALGLAGCAAWIIYQVVIFKSPFDFLNGPYSAGTQQQTAALSAALPTDHNALLSLSVYAHTTLDTLTWPVALAALLGLLWWIVRTRLRVSSWPVFIVLVPFAFNWLSLFLGMTTIETPEVPLNGIVTYFNVRYGMMMIPAAALFIASLATLRRELAPIILSLILLASSPVVAGVTPYTLQDPLVGVSAAGRALSTQEGHWLAAHYQGGKVLVSGGPFSGLMYESALPERTFLTDGDGEAFHAALAHPETAATWIIMTPNGGNFDPVWAALHGRSDWRQFYVLRQVIGATEIYGRTDAVSASAPQPLATNLLVSRSIPLTLPRPALPLSVLRHPVLGV
jgi:dolichyl-phosphate-mannose-protein mannosyltransferase